MKIQTAVHLLPTPTVNDSRSGRNVTAKRHNPESKHHAGTTLVDAVSLHQDWGKYLIAICIWESVFRDAPLPTIDTPTGRRLSPEFVEWMMGLPDGFTDVGISRAQRLKVLGNSVVPQQAALAWSLLV